MTRVLISAYRCDPEGVSEAYTGFCSVLQACESHEVLLCTPSYNLPAIERWLSSNRGTKAAVNLETLGVPMPDVDARLGSFGAAIKPGFFLYEQRLMAILRASGAAASVAVAWHRTPISFRFRTRLYTLGVPLIVGPLGGGLQPPEALHDYFGDEGLLYRLRALDKWLLGSRYWMRPLDRASRILVTADYVRDILPDRVGPKTVTLTDVAVDAVPEVDAPVGPANEAEGPFTVLFVGRMVRYKAPLLALEAFARFAERVTDRSAVRLVIVGEGPEIAVVTKRIGELGIDDLVTLTGALPRDETQKHFEAATVLLFPSLTEASGAVYLEGMQAGLPLVVADNGGGASLPSDSAAIKVPIADAETMVSAFADALMRLHLDSDLRRDMATAGRRHVADHYTWPVVGTATTRLLDEVAEHER